MRYSLNVIRNYDNGEEQHESLGLVNSLNVLLETIKKEVTIEDEASSFIFTVTKED